MTYQYKCKSCSHEEEIEQKMTEEAIAKCPKCKKKTFERVIFAARVQFKGTGFYTTDYKGKK